MERSIAAFFTFIAVTQLVTGHALNLVNVCDTKEINHSVPIDTGNTVDIGLFTPDGIRQTCFEPSLEYHVRVSVKSTDDYTCIKGMLMTSDVGKFPDDKVLSRPRSVRFEQGEKCEKVSSSGKAVVASSICEKNLAFGFTAPRNQKKTSVTFSYSIVFAYNDFLENKATTFYACSAIPITTSTSTPTPTISASVQPSTITSIPTPAPSTTMSTSFPSSTLTTLSTTTPTPTPGPLPDHCNNCDNESTEPLRCPKTTVFYNETRSMSVNGVEYQCVNRSPHKKITCESTCEKPFNCDSNTCPSVTHLQCSLVQETKSRKFNCIATDGSGRTRTERFDVDVQQRCSCTITGYTF